MSDRIRLVLIVLAIALVVGALIYFAKDPCDGLAGWELSECRYEQDLEARENSNSW